MLGDLGGRLGAVLEAWQSIGSQQDAGEFLLYLLNGMHEECKWEPQSAVGSASEAGDLAQAGTGSKKEEVHQSGGREDSPIQRIFGGEYRSTVKSKDEGDSVTLEAFTTLTLDITGEDVTDESLTHDDLAGFEITVNNTGLGVGALGARRWGRTAAF